MDKLEIINLYENSNKNRIEEFTSKTNSTLKVNIDKKKIVMDTIKVAGGYEFEVKLYPEVSTKMKVIIVPQA